MERKAARGEWTGGAVPFGYPLDAERHFLLPEPAEASIVPQLFHRYAERLEGSSALAKWLTERGCRTRQGKPFNVPAVLSILRNRAYVGRDLLPRHQLPGAARAARREGALRRAPRRSSQERSEDISLRRTNQSEYLLTGLVKCAHCGKRYVGVSANGNGGRYRYYICFSRQRYGKKACEADRLPADELEEAILGQLLVGARTRAGGARGDLRSLRRA